jgi:hypothetical protein
MGFGKNELKTFTAAIIEALCDVRVKARDSCRVNRTILHASEKLATRHSIQRSRQRH